MKGANQDAVVFVIEDPKKGDFANVLALGRLIADRLHTRLEVKKLTSRGNVLLPLLKGALCVGPRRGAGGSLRRAMQQVFFSGPYIGETQPVAVVSTLGRGEAQGAFVSAFWQAPSIHLGTPKRLPAEYFAAIVTHAGDAPKASEIPLSLSPTRVKLRRRSEARQVDGISRVCLLLGGDATGVAQYDMQFWSRCVNAAIKTAITYGAALIISTSPRSGPTVEALVEATARSAPVHGLELYLYGRGDRRDITAEILTADVVIVTAESVSMMSDAIASGARVVGLYSGDLPTSTRVRSFLGYHRTAGTLRLEDLSQWDSGPLTLVGIRPLTSCWSETLWPALEPVLAKELRNR